MMDVVIIDDEIWVTRMLEKLIRWEDFGFRVAGVYHDGREGLAGIRELKPQLVLTDIRMPGIMGLDIMREMSESGDGPMFIIISGYNDFEYARTALDYGALGYLLKPIDQAELGKYVGKAAELQLQKQAEQQKEKRLQSSMGEMMEKLRKQTFLNLFEGTGEAAESVSSLNTLLRLSFCRGEYMIVGVFIDSAELEQEINGWITRAIWQVNLPADCYEMLTLTLNQEVILVLNYAQGEIPKIEQSLTEMFGEVLSSRPACGVTMGIGEAVREIGGLQCSYRRMREMQMARLVHGPNRVYNSRTEPHTAQNEQQMLYPNFEISLKQAFDSGQIDTLSKLVSAAVDRFMAKAQRHPELLMRGINQMLLLFESSAPLTEDKRRRLFADKRRMLACAGSIGQIKQMLGDFAAELTALRAESENNMAGPAVQKALAYIESAYMQDISLSEVAEKVNLNPNYFCEVFKRETGENFKKYLIAKRIGSAKEMLRNPAYKFSEISELVGYNDTKNFGKSFKKLVGVTPGEYRRLMTGND